MKESYGEKFDIKYKDLRKACEYEKRHPYIRGVFNYVQEHYFPNEKNKETDTKVYQDIKTGLQIMIKSKTQYGAEDKKNMKDIIKSLKCHLNEFNEGEIESSQKDEERQEFMKLLSKSLTQKKENTEEEYIITNEQLIEILPLARSAHVRFYMNNDDPNSKVLNTRLIKLLHSVRNQKNYKDLVTSIIYTILNCNDIKKSDYKTVMDILLNEDYQNKYKECKNKYKECENKYENFLKICKNHNFNDIQKLFCCVMLTAKDKLDSKINVSDTLDNIIQNFMIKHDWPLKEQEEKNKENGTTNKSNKEKKETSKETKQEKKNKENGTTNKSNEEKKETSEETKQEEKKEEKKETLEEVYRRVIDSSIRPDKKKLIKNSNQNNIDYTLSNEYELKLKKDGLGIRKVDLHIKFNRNCHIEISEDFKIPILAGTEIIIEVDGPTHFTGNIVPKNLKDAQQTIFGQTVSRDDSIKRNFKESALKEKEETREKQGLINRLRNIAQRIWKKLWPLKKEKQDIINRLRDMTQRVEGNSNLLLQYACRLERFKQRRKIDNPEIIPIKSQETTKNSNASQEPIDLTGKNKDLIGVTAHSIKNSGLFFSVPLTKDGDKLDGTYDDKVLKKIFKNCLINAYYSQALLNLKEFYRREAEEEKKELENTETTQPSKQEQNGNQTTQEGKNEMLASLQGVGNCQTNRETGGSNALQKIKEAKEDEKIKIEKEELRLRSAMRQNMRTSGQGNVL